MPVQLPESAAMEEAVALIRRRIEEKRLYEAKFLCRQWRDAADAELVTLATAIAERLARAEDCRRQAREAMAMGRYAEADQLFSAVEAIAADIPGLAEEKRALAAAATLLRPPLPASATGPSPISAGRMADEPTPPATVAGNGSIPASLAPTEPRRKTSPVTWLIGGGLALLGVVGLCWYFWAQEPAPSLPIPRVQAVSPPVASVVAPVAPVTSPTQSAAPPVSQPAPSQGPPALPAISVTVPSSPGGPEQTVSPAFPSGVSEPAAVPQPKPGSPGVTPSAPSTTPAKTAPSTTTPAPGLKVGTLQIQPAPRK